MIITLLGNMNHTYHQALRAAYDKGKAEGALDEQTIVECEAVFSRERYHAENENIAGGDANGGTCYQLSGLQQGYEEAMERARKRHGFANLESAEGVKEVLYSDSPDIGQQPPSVTNDNTNNLKALFVSVGLSIQHQQRLARMFNMVQSLRPPTLERAETVANLEREDKDRSANDVVLDVTIIDQRQIARQF
ncbi:MAG: hypothetical protein JWQ69_1063 [Pseudomonas sp.]|nr:hypothetical protein [Pseudomonas sp.]